MEPEGNLESNKSINERWKHRRRMAWLSLYTLISIVVVSVIFPDRITDTAGILMTIITCLTTIVLGYTGMATYDDVKNHGIGYRRGRRDENCDPTTPYSDESGNG